MKPSASIRMAFASVFLISLTAALPSGIAQTPAAAPKHAPTFVDPAHYEVRVLIAPPPAKGSLSEQAELSELRAIQSARTVSQLARAQVDNDDETIFIYRDVLGPKFNPDTLPVTAAFAKSLHNDAEMIVDEAKTHFGRTRPYAVDRSIMGCPYDPKKKVNTSYPSGHAMNGYTYGYVLAAMLPDKAEAILARARDYAENRLVCGHHFRSDVDASAVLAGVVVRDLASDARFRDQLAKVKAELLAAGIAS